ncbi:MAG: beta-lactamase family protein [Cyclobacteriaceae bacterium]|nr:beta-lactamase family protein [Cyclobacteriaceae bacterium]
MKRLAFLFYFVIFTGSAFAQPLTDTVALEGFMDGVMETHFRDKHIVGAAVSIIKDGKVLLAKGYGYMDERNRIPVTANASLFRIGSITKLFTWVSVMQLVQQGKLDLNADVNTYLKDFQIPATYPEPITLNHLMTHTPGFEDLVIGLFGRDTTSLKPLEEILKNQIPARVRKPGTYASYSNHGTAMAAYIVELVSGMQFNEYVEKNIIGPLGMKQTTLRQPLPKEFVPQMSKGYKYEGGVFAEKPYEYVPLYPAGSAATTALDMVPFMRMFLENGQLNGAVILDSATLALMKTPAHQHDPAVNPMRHGLIDMSRGGVEVIGHGGDTFWFHSMLALMPASQTGIFLSFNTDTGGGTAGVVLDEFLDRYFPETTQPQPPKFSKDYLTRFAGKYRVNRHAYKDYSSVAGMLSDASVTVLDSTGLRLKVGETVRDLVPIDSLVFREKNTSNRYVFQKAEKGDIGVLLIGNVPILALEKVSGLKSADLHMFIFILAIITAVVTLLFWPIVALSRMGYQAHRYTKPMPFNARLIAWLNYLVLIIFYVGVTSNANEEGIVYGTVSALKFFLYFPFLNLLLTVGMLIWLVRILPTGYHRVMSRLYYLVLCLVSLAALWQLYYWNMFGA